ncbi:hypothetical protein ABZ260_43850, partial [Streptosporangium sp. NPDC006013]|uniref:hypothetical protein n=1 Tax=Streptosporangium sp. NPDC006013 TaxID=3155596 RepID=UPI0033AD125D
QMEHEALSNLQAELFQVRVALNQLRAEVARHHDTEDHTTADVNEVNANAAGSVAGLDGIISRIHCQLTQR